MIQGLYTLGHMASIDFKLLKLAYSIISEEKTQRSMRNKMDPRMFCAMQPWPESNRTVRPDRPHR